MGSRVRVPPRSPKKSISYGTNRVARIGLLRALNAGEPCEFKERKEHHWGRRKLKRDHRAEYVNTSKQVGDPDHLAARRIVWTGPTHDGSERHAPGPCHSEALQMAFQTGSDSERICAIMNAGRGIF